MKVSKRVVFLGYEQYEHQKNQLVDAILEGFYKENEELSVAEMARRAGIAPSTMSRINSFKTRFPRLDTLFKMIRGSKQKVSMKKMILKTFK